MVTRAAQARAEALAGLMPRSLGGGQKHGTCADHPHRQSVFIRRGAGWMDTGMCASDLNRYVRAVRNTTRGTSSDERR